MVTFPHSEDACYLAYHYPYTYTALMVMSSGQCHHPGQAERALRGFPGNGQETLTSWWGTVAFLREPGFAITNVVAFCGCELLLWTEQGHDQGCSEGPSGMQCSAIGRSSGGEGGAIL